MADERNGAGVSNGVFSLCIPVRLLCLTGVGVGRGFGGLLLGRGSGVLSTSGMGLTAAWVAEWLMADGRVAMCCLWPLLFLPRG